MTPEEAQKRLEAILADHDQKVRNSSGKYYAGDPVEINSRAAEQAIAELFRDVIGEIVGADEQIDVLLDGTFDADHKHQHNARLAKQREVAAHYFPVDSGGEK